MPWQFVLGPVHHPTTAVPELSNLTDMSEMFDHAIAFNLDIGNWDTSNVTNLSGMLCEATAFNQNIGGWIVTSLIDATNMFRYAGLSTANYDLLLIGWNSRALQSGVTFDAGNSTYCAGEAARANMISSKGWSITDGGKASSCSLPYLPVILNNGSS